MIITIILTVLGALLRFTDLNWDLGGRLHPDEALLVNGALTVRFFSHLFPGFHDYNGFSMYLLRTVALFVSLATRNTTWITTPESLTLVGRFLSAAISTASIPLMYLIGTLVGGVPTGLIAAALFTFTPLSIQLAHFYTTDTLLVFFLLVLIYTVLRYWRKPSVRRAAGMAIAVGLAIATKNTAYLFLPLPVAAILLTPRVIRTKLTGLIAFAMVSLSIFFLGSPYSFLDFAHYLSRSEWIAEVVNGTFIFGWSAQFQHTTPVFWFTNLVTALGALAILGPVGIWTLGNRLKLWRRTNRNFSLQLIAVWSIGFSIFLALTYLKFIRYDAPLIPVFTLFTAIFLTSVRRSRLGKVLIAAALSIQILWGVMFFHIYLIPHTSITASHWIAEHIPAHAVIITEDWNSIINFESRALYPYGYDIRRINFYDAETPQKLATIADAFKQSDYLISESPKIKNTIHRVRADFPSTEAFYEDLASGKLGFTKVVEFTSYPQLGPLLINDESAEETWYDFDHPTVTIYARKGVCAPHMACK